jgi:hypothetical protein
MLFILKYIASHPDRLVNKFRRPRIAFPIFYHCRHRGCRFWRGQTSTNKYTLVGWVADYHNTQRLLPRLQILGSAHSGTPFRQNRVPHPPILEAWKKAFPDPANSPGHHTRTLEVHCTSSKLAVDMEEGGLIRAFCNVVRLEIVMGMGNRVFRCRYRSPHILPGLQICLFPAPSREPYHPWHRNHRRSWSWERISTFDLAPVYWGAPALCHRRGGIRDTLVAGLAKWSPSSEIRVSLVVRRRSSMDDGFGGCVF